MSAEADAYGVNLKHRHRLMIDWLGVVRQPLLRNAW